MAIDLQTLKHPPMFCEHPVSAVSFFSCALHLAQQPEAIKDFCESTKITLPVSALDRMIDEATGHDALIAAEWLSFVSHRYWGCICCPDEAR